MSVDQSFNPILHTMKYAKVQEEEELKNKVAQDFFGKFDCTEIIEKIDFTVKSKGKKEHPGSYFLWAEAKAASTDIGAMLTQLILTIGKARTFDKITSPPNWQASATSNVHDPSCCSKKSFS